MDIPAYLAMHLTGWQPRPNEEKHGRLQKSAKPHWICWLDSLALEFDPNDTILPTMFLRLGDALLARCQWMEAVVVSRTRSF